jgi:hypothetical protein
MRSHVFHRLFTPACARFRQWSLRLLIPGVLALTGGAPHANGSPIQLAPQDLQIELPADSLFGSIPVNRRLTVFIHVPDSPAWQGIPLLARFEIPDTAPYIVPMDMAHNRHATRPQSSPAIQTLANWKAMKMMMINVSRMMTVLSPNW